MDSKAFISSFNPHNLLKLIDNFLNFGGNVLLTPASTSISSLLPHQQSVGLGRTRAYWGASGSFSSSYALGLIQGNGVSQLLMHFPPLPRVTELQ